MRYKLEITFDYDELQQPWALDDICLAAYVQIQDPEDAVTDNVTMKLWRETS